MYVMTFKAFIIFLELRRSDWDLHVCLHQECRRKQLKKPSYLNAWGDLRLMYTKFYGRRPEGLRGALQDMGLLFDGREHSGLCDAKNTAKLAFKLAEEGCSLVVTKFTDSSDVSARIKKMELSTRVSRE